jgi:hypothetical protein
MLHLPFSHWRNNIGSIPERYSRSLDSKRDAPRREPYFQREAPRREPLSLPPRPNAHIVDIRNVPRSLPQRSLPPRGPLSQPVRPPSPRRSQPVPQVENRDEEKEEEEVVVKAPIMSLQPLPVLKHVNSWLKPLPGVNLTPEKHPHGPAPPPPPLFSTPPRQYSKERLPTPPPSTKQRLPFPPPLPSTRQAPLPPQKPHPLGPAPPPPRRSPARNSPLPPSGPVKSAWLVKPNL